MAEHEPCLMEVSTCFSLLLARTYNSLNLPTCNGFVLKSFAQDCSNRSSYLLYSKILYSVDLIRHCSLNLHKTTA